MGAERFAGVEGMALMFAVRWLKRTMSMFGKRTACKRFSKGEGKVSPGTVRSSQHKTSTD